MRFLIVLLICILFAVSCGCTQAPAVPGPAAATPAAVTSAPATPAAASPVPATGNQLSSDNPNATLTLDPGTLVVSFSAKNAQKLGFSFSPVNNESYGAATEMATNGPYDGSVAFQVPVRGVYQLNITGTGQWTAGTAPLATVKPLRAPVNLSGAGTQVSPAFYLERGDYIFERNVTGFASPYYFLGFANGSPLMDANNSYIQPGLGPGISRPFGIVTIPESGIYYLSVLGRENPGPWSASITMLPKIPMGPGPAISWSTGTPANQTT